MKVTFASDLCRTTARNSLGFPNVPSCFKTMKANETYKKIFINYLQRSFQIYLILTHFNTDELTKSVTMFNVEINREG